jgi:hypothetical protein
LVSTQTSEAALAEGARALRLRQPLSDYIVRWSTSEVGSKGDMPTLKFDFRFPLQSRHPTAGSSCPKSIATTLTRAVSVLLATMSPAGYRQISFDLGGAIGMCGTVHLSGRHSRPVFGRTCHEIVVKLCRALSCRYRVNCIAVRSERDGSVANRNTIRHPASWHHGQRAEAGGKAT